MALVTPLTTSSLEQAILRAIEQYIADEAEKVLVEAQAKLEQKIRQSLGALCMSVSSYYTVERINGVDIRIHVKDQREAGR